ncbi:pyridoxal-dependent decarboxylase [Neobacillus drentensis]
MVKRMEKDQEKIDLILEKFVQHTKKFFKELDSRRVAVSNHQINRQELLEEGIGLHKALDVFEKEYSKSLSASTGPRYLGFVTGGSTPASILGDWLTSLYDQNVMMTEDSIAGYMEIETIEMLKDLFSLSKDYSGTFVSGATMANFIGLAQARQWAAHHYKVDVSQQGLFKLPPIKVLGGAIHSSVYKALAMLGMGRECVQPIDLQLNREAIETSVLRSYLEENKNEPCIVIANAGTVNTVDFDDLSAIGKLKEDYNFWLHIDAAFGGFAACSPKYKILVEGINLADSITIDAHKWLNVPYDSAMQFTRHKHLQVEVFQNNAAYLGSSISNPEFIHLTPENSRRFRALPAWFTLKAYGKKGYQELFERNIEMASMLKDKIEQSEQFIMLAPVRLNVVCFTLNQEGLTTDTVYKFIELLNEDGRVFVTPTIYKNKPAIRAAFSNWRTKNRDIYIIWNALTDAAKKINNDG